MIGFWAPAPRLIDDAAPEDLPHIAEIHRASFTQEWTVDELAALLSQPGVTALVVRRASWWTSPRPIGFLLLRVAADEAEILTVAVHPSNRRGGVGRSLVAEALRRLYADRVATVFLEVAADNEAALAIYRRLGFTMVGERPAYYSGTGAGGGLALVMRCDLG
ncbi:GNAT family N-acetyltransferase [Amorphus coralli]|uniref:GNAT family N-acetyltransferase n=1 Tax=Amorphus coralli TaxID=340680 RepID=UPI00036A9731|nr:GNAT family N-acetyltransferase [Amorphus coralli]